MREASSLEVKDLRWRWALAGVALGCGAVLALTPIYLVLAAAALGLTGLAVFRTGHRTAGARLASLGLGSLIPVAAGAVLVGINSL
ncbi:hypothetical protein [Rhodococcus koreensis]